MQPHNIFLLKLLHMNYSSTAVVQDARPHEHLVWIFITFWCEKNLQVLRIYITKDGNYSSKHKIQKNILTLKQRSCLVVSKYKGFNYYCEEVFYSQVNNYKDKLLKGCGSHEVHFPQTPPNKINRPARI
jgi:hypothetical protein